MFIQGVSSGGARGAISHLIRPQSWDLIYIIWKNLMIYIISKSIQQKLISNNNSSSWLCIPNIDLIIELAAILSNARSYPPSADLLLCIFEKFSTLFADQRR